MRKEWVGAVHSLHSLHGVPGFWLINTCDTNLEIWGIFQQSESVNLAFNEY